MYILVLHWFPELMAYYIWLGRGWTNSKFAGCSFACPQWLLDIFSRTISFARLSIGRWTDKKKKINKQENYKTSTSKYFPVFLYKSFISWSVLTHVSLGVYWPAILRHCTKINLEHYWSQINLISRALLRLVVVFARNIMLLWSKRTIKSLWRR